MPTENRSSNTEMVSVPREPSAEMLDAARNAPIPLVHVDSMRARQDLEFAARYKAAVARASQPAQQPHPEPIAWMVGTAIWWTKEEAEMDAAETGLPIIGLGPMTDPGEVERLRSIERSYGLREALLEQVKGERDRMIARTMELSGQLADQDALLHKLKQTLQREYWDEYAGLEETRELIDAAISANAEPSPRVAPYPNRLCHIDYSPHPHRCGCLKGDEESQRIYDEHCRTALVRQP
ncbi:hypothetical protein [Pseudomonas putida]|uniref:hypothetical protein n=1 Tax=Pseudomonas putida TaxID=303 RepID=UPI00384B4CFD